VAHVLVVDDDQELRHSVCDVLAFAGHQVEGAAHGKEALNRLTRRPPIECMVLDMHMPNFDGIAVLEELDAEKPAVVVLSAFEYVDKAEVVKRFGHRVCAFLVKPAPPMDLIRTVERCLAAPDSTEVQPPTSLAEP